MPAPAIADHGRIGDLQTAALVATDGTVDWFCCPRFDSPSVFASLLDDDKGGRFSVRATAPGTVTKQLYLPDTAILITRFLSERGVAEVHDFMPVRDPHVASDHRRLVRAIVGVRGEIELEARVEPRFDYGRQAHTVAVRDGHARFEAPDLTLSLASVWPLQRHGDDVRTRFTVRAADVAGPAREMTTRSSAAAACASCTTTRWPSGRTGSGAAGTGAGGARRCSARPSASSS